MTTDPSRGTLYHCICLANNHSPIKSFRLWKKTEAVARPRVAVDPIKAPPRPSFFGALLRQKKYFPSVKAVNFKGFLDSRFTIHGAVIVVAIFTIILNLTRAHLASAANSSTILESYLTTREETEIVLANYDDSWFSATEPEEVAPVLTLGEEAMPSDVTTVTVGNSLAAATPVVPETYTTSDNTASVTASGSKRDPTTLYYVKGGDTLSSIASAFGITSWTLYQSNNFVDQIKPGQGIHIPRVDGYIHVVSEGQTLSGIAQKYSVSVADIRRTNDLGEDQTILAPGQFLVVPGVRLSKPAPQPAAATNRGSAASSGISNEYSDATPTGDSGGIGNPLPGARWCQSFKGRSHTGVDLCKPVGSPIYAAADGVVSFVGWSSGYGKLIRVRHSGNRETYYAHLSEFYVSAGESVGRGQALGEVGMTGWTTGPHLHFELRVGGSPINPGL